MCLAVVCVELSRLFSDLVTISHGNYVKNTYILVAYRIILCPDTTADIAGMVFITAVMSQSI